MECDACHKRGKTNAKLNVHPPRFDIRYYVLVAKINTKIISKLAVRWMDPARIVASLNDWTFQFVGLRDGTISVRHASRLKFYHDVSWDVTAELLHDVAYVAGSHLVEKVLSISGYRDVIKWKARIRWHGLEDVEASSEPLKVMWEDIPLLINEWIKDKKVQDFIATLPLPSPKKRQKP